ncbi:MAG: 50S ribosomal protein L4 [Solirubrobacterales bacterium]
MSEAAKKIDAPILGKSGKVSLDANVFGEPFNGTLVHEVVRAERNAKRSGNASTKGRGDVAMTGAKAWRQKGTGRARIGAQSAGHRRGGGITFGPTPRDYVFKVNRKARRKALRAALSLHAERGTLAIIEAASFKEPSTADAFDNLFDWNENGSVAVITAGETDVNTAKSFRNIKRVRAVMAANQVGVYEVTAAQNLVISQEALEALSSLATSELDRSSKKPIEAVPVKAATEAKSSSSRKPRASEGDSPAGDPPVAEEEAPADAAPSSDEAAEEATE